MKKRLENAPQDELKRRLEAIILESGVTGIEAVYPGQEGDIEFYLDLAHRYGLTISGGSDFHDASNSTTLERELGFGTNSFSVPCLPSVGGDKDVVLEQKPAAVQATYPPVRAVSASEPQNPPLEEKPDSNQSGRYGSIGVAPQSVEDIISMLPEEWRNDKNELSLAEFIQELSDLLQIENILKQDKSAFIFSEKVTFDNGLGVFLPKLVKSGMKVAVIATNDRQRALINELNQDKSENERIVYADTIADIRTKVHTARYYYFKVNGDPGTDLQGVTTFDITEIVKKIIYALGKVCGIVDRKGIELLHEAAHKFAEAA